jgi:hypothetical protein
LPARRARSTSAPVDREGNGPDAGDARAGRYVAKKFNVSFDAKKLMADPSTTFSLAPPSSAT